MTKDELLKELFVKYNLFYDKNDPESKDNDVYIHKHYKTITRSGIEKIEKAAGITIDYQFVGGGPEWAAIKAVGWIEQGKPYTTFASANSVNCKSAYYVELAEKRAKSRIVLKLAGLYELGIYGADEMSKDEEPKTPQVTKRPLFAGSKDE